MSLSTLSEICSEERGTEKGRPNLWTSEMVVSLLEASTFSFFSNNF